MNKGNQDLLLGILFVILLHLYLQPLLISELLERV